MAAADNKALITAIFDDLARGDSRRFAAALHPDFAWVVTGSSSWSGRHGGGLRAVSEAFLKPLNSRLSQAIRTTPSRISADGGVVIVEGKGAGVTTEGAPYENDYCLIYVFKDGQIAEQIEYMDSAYCEAVLGKWDDVLAAYKAGDVA
ncbi:MAG TPA: nuclear transport factor 2 family protein [Caulobacteraceae bacterium]|jgi:hypothetical protein